MRARWRSAAIRLVEHPTLTLHWSRQAVNFGETDADSVVLSSYNHRVIARRQARPNRRLEWIGWCEIGGSDPRSLIGVRFASCRSTQAMRRCRYTVPELDPPERC